MNKLLAHVLVLLAISFIAPCSLYCQGTIHTVVDSIIRNDHRLFTPSTVVSHNTTDKQEDSLTTAQFIIAAISAYQQPPGSPLNLVQTNNDTPPLFLRYDRADGIYIGIGSGAWIALDSGGRTSLSVHGGYAFGSHYWQGTTGVKQDILDCLSITARGYIITDTEDSWKMGMNENTVFALLTGIDTRRYFRRSGFTAAATYNMPDTRISITGEFAYNHYRNALRTVRWALFGPDLSFLSVPNVDEGLLPDVALTVTVDEYSTRLYSSHAGFGMGLRIETGAGERPYARYILDTRLRLPVWHASIVISSHIRAGSATGNAPVQKHFTAGGIASLPGFRQDEYKGNRMVIAQTDLILSFFPAPLNDLTVIVSNDYAIIGNQAESSGVFSGFHENATDGKYSTGIYLGSRTGTFRIGAAWRTDNGASPAVIARLAHRF